MTDTLTIDSNRIGRRLMALADITEPNLPWTRRSFTPRLLEGRTGLQTAFDEAGLHAEIDAAGNLVGRRHGSDNNLAPLVLGSHSDTVPAGGRFDGVLGVVRRRHAHAQRRRARRQFRRRSRSDRNDLRTLPRRPQPHTGRMGRTSGLRRRGKSHA